MPRLLFYSDDGPEFEFDGSRCSIAAISDMLVDIYRRAECLFQEEILMGITEEELGVRVDFDGIRDELANEDAGYGFLNNPGFSKHIEIMRAFLKHPKFKNHFYVRDGDRLIWAPDACKMWLGHVSKLKELFYILNHYLGMPKRGSEEDKFKIFNLTQRNRNVFWMLRRLAFVGNYSKTSALHGADCVTLHLPPKCLGDLILRFYCYVGKLEKLFVREFFPEAKPNWACYLYSSCGKRWNSKHLSTILHRESKRYLDIKLGLSPLQHLLPALAEHYEIGIDCEHTSVRHTQQGHSKNLAGRLYSRTVGSHPALTNDIVREVRHFCDRWQALLGFSSPNPQCMTAAQIKLILHSPMQKQDSELASVVKELIASLRSEPHSHRFEATDKFNSAPKILVTPSSTTNHMISPDPMYSSKGNKDGHNSPTWAGDETTLFYDQVLEDDHLAEEFNHTTNVNHLEFCKHMPLVSFSIPSN